MTYASLLEAYGWDRFAEDARAAGATSLIVADLPAGERPELRRVQLVAPTSTDERLRLAAEQTDGWLYLVTLTGTTGARTELSPALAPLVERARRLTDAPLYAGFGISTPEHARGGRRLADGIVVGSRAVEVAEEGPAALRAYVASPPGSDRRCVGSRPVEHYRLEPVADGVLAAIALSGGGGVGQRRVVDLGGATLVFDTGMTPQAGAELRAAAEQIAPVSIVANSHWHGDHVRGNQASPAPRSSARRERGS